MVAPDFTRKSDTELMRFCATTARTLDTLNRRISAFPVPAPEMEAAFHDLSARLDAALAELDSRYSAPGTADT